jgi:hypothetical protein
MYTQRLCYRHCTILYLLYCLLHISTLNLSHLQVATSIFNVEAYLAIYQIKYHLQIDSMKIKIQKHPVGTMHSPNPIFIENVLILRFNKRPEDGQNSRPKHVEANIKYKIVQEISDLTSVYVI